MWPQHGAVPGHCVCGSRGQRGGERGVEQAKCGVAPSSQDEGSWDIHGSPAPVPTPRSLQNLQYIEEASNVLHKGKDFCFHTHLPWIPGFVGGISLYHFSFFEILAFAGISLPLPRPIVSSVISFPEQTPVVYFMLLSFLNFLAEQSPQLPEL